VLPAKREASVCGENWRLSGFATVIDWCIWPVAWNTEKVVLVSCAGFCEKATGGGRKHSKEERTSRQSYKEVPWWRPPASLNTEKHLQQVQAWGCSGAAKMATPAGTVLMSPGAVDRLLKFLHQKIRGVQNEEDAKNLRAALVTLVLGARREQRINQLCDERLCLRQFMQCLCRMEGMLARVGIFMPPAPVEVANRLTWQLAPVPAEEPEVQLSPARSVSSAGSEYEFSYLSLKPDLTVQLVKVGGETKRVIANKGCPQNKASKACRTLQVSEPEASIADGYKVCIALLDIWKKMSQTAFYSWHSRARCSSLPRLAAEWQTEAGHVQRGGKFRGNAEEQGLRPGFPCNACTVLGLCKCLAVFYSCKNYAPAQLEFTEEMLLLLADRCKLDFKFKLSKERQSQAVECKGSIMVGNTLEVAMDAAKLLPRPGRGEAEGQGNLSVGG
jgi:hypothetical protein